MIDSHEWMFDISVPGCFRPATKRDSKLQHKTTKPEPVDIFNGDGEEKIFRMSLISNADISLNLAVEAIRYFYYKDQDEFNPFNPKHGLYGMRYIDNRDAAYRIEEGVESWLKEKENEWHCNYVMQPLHKCYKDFVRPLQKEIQRLFADEEN